MQRHDCVAFEIGGELRALIEDKPDRRGMRLEKKIGRFGFRDHVRALGAECRIGILADIGIGPAVESALLQMGEIIGNEAVAITVALVHRHPHGAGARIEGDADRIARAGGEGRERAVGVDRLHAGARGRFGVFDISAAADGEIKLARRREGDIARPVIFGAAEILFGDARPGAGFQRAVLVSELPHRMDVADIERAIVEGQAVRPVEAGGEGCDRCRLVGAAQDRDRSGFRFGQKHIAIGRQRHPARIGQARSIDRNREALGRGRRHAFRTGDYLGAIVDGRRDERLGQIGRGNRVMLARIIGGHTRCLRRRSKSKHHQGNSRNHPHACVLPCQVS